MRGGGGGGDGQDGPAGGQPIAPCEETERHGSDEMLIMPSARRTMTRIRTARLPWSMVRAGRKDAKCEFWPAAADGSAVAAAAAIQALRVMDN